MHGISCSTPPTSFPGSWYRRCVEAQSPETIPWPITAAVPILACTGPRTLVKASAMDVSQFSQRPFLPYVDPKLIGSRWKSQTRTLTLSVHKHSQWMASMAIIRMFVPESCVVKSSVGIRSFVSSVS
jgi:hypothetical protein